MIETLKIILLCMTACIGYGIVHDQITVRICLEYFTIGHPKLIDSEDPTTLALLWGVVATWWVGLLIGVPIAASCRLGSTEKWVAGQLIKPMFVMLAACFMAAILAGLSGWLAASQGWVYLVPPLADRVPLAQHVPYLIDLWAHIASYVMGLCGALLVSCWVWRKRSQSHMVSVTNK